MQLRDWQEKLQQKILYPDRPDDILQTWLDSQHMDTKVQLEIYSYAYAARLIEALQANYPAVYQLLGDDEFTRMGKRYLDNHPSTHPSIRWFGNSLATFLATTQPYRDLPVLAELAQFEWALRHTVDAADAERLRVEDLQCVALDAWADLQFSLHPSTTLLALQWNTPQVWKSLTPETPAGEGDAVEPTPQAGYWLVYRRADLVSSWRSIATAEQRALACLQQGGSFADICEQVDNFHAAKDEPGAGDAAAVVAGFLRHWINEGILNRL